MIPPAPDPGDGFAVDPAALRAAAGSFDGEADALDAAGAALEAGLAALGAPWGADEVGRRFAAGYLPAAKVVLDNVGALSIGLVRIAAALSAAGQAYEATDAAVAAATSPAGSPAAGAHAGGSAVRT